MIWPFNERSPRTLCMAQMSAEKAFWEGILWRKEDWEHCNLNEWCFAEACSLVLDCRSRPVGWFLAVSRNVGDWNIYTNEKTTIAQTKNSELRTATRCSQSKYTFVTPERLELSTHWLRVSCSTNWATESCFLSQSGCKDIAKFSFVQILQEKKQTFSICLPLRRF